MFLDALIVFFEVVVFLVLVLGFLWLVVSGLGYIEMLVRGQEVRAEDDIAERRGEQAPRRHVPLPR
jgi:hypothetical protein